MNYELFFYLGNDENGKVITNMEFNTPFWAYEFLRQLGFTYQVCGKRTELNPHHVEGWDVPVLMVFHDGTIPAFTFLLKPIY